MKQLQTTYLRLLAKFVQFKTVSTDATYTPEMKRVVAWLSQLFKKNSFEVTILEAKNINPVLVAKYVKDPKLQTVLVYGHYDVQPALTSDGWKSDPFVLIKNKKRFLARGAIDNKGQIMAHMSAVFEAIEKGTLACNATFIIEGNEESGNPALAQLIEKNKKLLACDLVMISDGEIIGKNPTIETSFRGGGNLCVIYTTSSNDRHSGLTGGAIPNAAFELACLAAKIKKNNVVAFKAFYTGARAVTASEKKMNGQLSKIESFKQIAGVKKLLTETGLDPFTQTGLRPTIEISGISSGYTGVGFKNIVPGRAEMRLNVRTVYPQNSKKVLAAIKAFITKQTPQYVDVVIEGGDGSDAIALDVNHASILGIKKLLEEVYQKKVLYHAVGGGIPVVADFHSVLKKPIAMVPFASSDCNMHGVDENFATYHLQKALEFTRRFWSML